MPYYHDSKNGLHWLDDDAFAHLLPEGCVEITKAEAAAIEAVNNAPQPIPLTEQAQSALDASDMVALRCYKATVPYPAEWHTYTQALRAIVSGADTASTALPTKPSYPAGT
jgi:hypothetical protein